MNLIHPIGRKLILTLEQDPLWHGRWKKETIGSDKNIMPDDRPYDDFLDYLKDLQNKPGSKNTDQREIALMCVLVEIVRRLSTDKGKQLKPTAKREMYQFIA